MSLLTTLARGSAVPVKAAVQEHVERMCQTRRGSVLVAPDYGVDDVTEHFHEMPAGVEQVRAQIEATIRRFEPRLARVSVVRLEPAEPSLTVRFEVHGALVSNGHVGSVRFATAIDSSRRVTSR